jgi:hypothetical protein
VQPRAADIRVIQAVKGVRVTLDEEGGWTKIGLNQTAQYQPGCVQLLEIKSQEILKICVAAQKKPAGRATRWAETTINAGLAALALVAGYVVFGSWLS